MRAYLAKRASIVPLKESRLPTTYHLNHADGLKVREFEKGSPFIELTDRQEETGDIPEEVDEVVEIYSLNTNHYGAGAKTSRELGLYRLGSASATVTRNEHGYHFIAVRGRVAADVILLSNRIVAGTIAPAQSYEREQVKAGLPGLKAAFHQLIESAFRAFDGWRLA